MWSRHCGIRDSVVCLKTLPNFMLPAPGGARKRTPSRCDRLPRQGPLWIAQATRPGCLPTSTNQVMHDMRFLIGPSVEELSEYSGGMQRGRHKRQPASEGGGRAPRGHNRWWRGCVWRAVECVSSVLGVGAVCARHRPNSHPAAASRSRSARCLRPALSLSFSSSRAPTVLGSQAQSFSFFCSRLHSSPCAAFCCSSFPAA